MLYLRFSRIFEDEYVVIEGGKERHAMILYIKVVASGKQPKRVGCIFLYIVCQKIDDLPATPIFA